MEALSLSTAIEQSEQHEAQPILLAQTKLFLNKCFMAKSSALKLQLNDKNECYLHLGKLNQEEWYWKKIKINQNEIGDIIRLLLGKESKLSFFHQYNNEGTSIHVSRSKDVVFFKIGDFNKALVLGEQEVMRVLLERILLQVNFE